MMQAKKCAGWLAWLSALMCWSMVAQGAEVWKLASTEWPPFSTETLPGGGAGILALQEIMQPYGVTIEYEMLPWARAKDMVNTTDGYVGYYPSWPDEVVASQSFASEVVFRSPVGFAQRKDAPIAWTSFDDLKTITIAVVASYVYPKEFQDRISSGAISSLAADDDATALKMLASGRVQAAAVDKNNMLYLLRTDPDLKASAEALDFNAKELNATALVIGFKDTPENKARAAKLKEALSKQSAQEKVDAYIKSY
jgi:polar amino acid transport system substrate-binding protein